LAEEAVFAANEAIHSRAQRNARLSGMGTTLVGLLTGDCAEEARVWILNVGDSRCYRLRGGRLDLRTQDHSLVEEQVRMGRMTRAEAARSPLRNVITRALGTHVSVTADVIEEQVEPGDLFLLCSDGLTRELSDEKIQALLNGIEPVATSVFATLAKSYTKQNGAKSNGASANGNGSNGSSESYAGDSHSGMPAAEAFPSLDDLCARLIQAANKAGGHDNITCLLIRVE
jgi:protein phosphatase